MPTIDGTILVSNLTLDRWVREAMEIELEYRSRDKASAAYAYGPNGASHMTECIEKHCRDWCFFGKDRENLKQLAYGLYEESRKFLFDGFQPKPAALTEDINA